MNIFWKTRKISGTWKVAAQDICQKIKDISYHSKKKDGGSVTFENNVKSKIKGIGIIGKIYSVKIEDVQYVEGLKYNLLSISQLCDNDFEVISDLTCVR